MDSGNPREISLIAAMSINRVIGKNNQIPWRIPTDMRWFKKLTMGSSVIYGRKTFESMGKPLPNRFNVVLTNNASPHPDVIAAKCLADAIGACPLDKNIFICGGSSVYSEGLKIADKMYITLVQKEIEGDTVFPNINDSDWDLLSRLRPTKEPDDEYEVEFLVFIRERMEHFANVVK